MLALLRNLLEKEGLTVLSFEFVSFSFFLKKFILEWMESGTFLKNLKYNFFTMLY